MMSSAQLEETVASQDLSHRSVLLRETTVLLRPAPGQVFVDATLGAGGHAEALLEAMSGQGRVIGIDRDPGALTHATRRLARFGDRFTAIRGRYEDLAVLLQGGSVFTVDGVVADLGVSSLQLDDPQRGFSFRTDGPLDMRMDPSIGPSAADLLAGLSEVELVRILRTYGEERQARPIVRAIVRTRADHPLLRTRQLAEVVERVAGPMGRRYRIHPATRTFQALRIAVNHEIEGLERFVTDAASLLRRGGRLAVISFHSVEDRAIKKAMKALAERCICPPRLPVCGCGREDLVRIITPRSVTASREELDGNPRARSARLRVVERL